MAATTQTLTSYATYSDSSIAGCRNNGNDYRTCKNNSYYLPAGFFPSLPSGWSSASRMTRFTASWQGRVTNTSVNGSGSADEAGLLGQIVLFNSISLSGNDITGFNRASIGTTSTITGTNWSTDWKNSSTLTLSPGTYTDSVTGERLSGIALDRAYMPGLYLTFRSNTTLINLRVYVRNIQFNYDVQGRCYVTFMADGTQVQKNNVCSGDVPSCTAPAKAGYTFAGWQSSLTGSTYTGTLPVAGTSDVTYTAVYTKNNCTVTLVGTTNPENPSQTTGVLVAFDSAKYADYNAAYAANDYYNSGATGPGEPFIVERGTVLRLIQFIIGGNAAHTLAYSCEQITDGVNTYNLAPSIGDQTLDYTVTKDVTLQMILLQIPCYGTTITSGSGGRIDPNISYSYGKSTDETAYTIRPNTGYMIDDVLLDGVSLGPVTSYAFQNVTGMHTLRATFRPLAPVFVSCSMKYGGTKISISNKVPAGSSCILSVGVE